MIQNVVDLFFPKVCSGCQSFLETNEKVICTVCRHEIPLTNHHLQLENEMYKRFYGRIPLEFASALFYFHKKGIVQQLIHNLKYRGHQEIGTEIGNWFAEDLKEIEILKTVDEIIPVPLHKKRYKERGYNQVTTFGEAVSKNLNIPYNPALLVRKVYSKTQSKKDLSGRNESIATLFDVAFTEKDHNKHFLIIDDVVTSGATLEACAKVLLKIPGARISIVCMASTHN